MLLEFALNNDHPYLGSDAGVILTSLYEHLTGIYPHLSQNEMNPLASIGFFACEDVNENSLLAQNIESYIALGIYEATGLNWTEFNALPTDVSRLIVKSVAQRSRKKEEIAENVESEFKKLS